MGAEKLNIICVNAGSSSVKLAIYSVSSDGSNFELLAETSVKDTNELSLWIDKSSADQPISAVGHRIVHGGPRHFQPEIITDDLTRDLETLTSYDLEHLPLALQLIDLFRKKYPELPHVACFDTGFFHNTPRVAQILPLPHRFLADGLRRYGFHGLSYTYLQAAFREIAGEDAANNRVIYAHLGSGASLAATVNGKPTDTTMGFTPASGIIMSTRSGDIDPGLANYLNRQYGVSMEEFHQIVNFESGLLGVSEISADMKSLLDSEKSHEQAADAVNLFVYQVKKAIGALSTTIGGIDSLIISGGMGEVSSVIRERICSGLEYLGIELDDDANQKNARLISSESSRVGVHVIHTDEAKTITTQVLAIMNSNQGGTN